MINLQETNKNKMDKLLKDVYKYLQKKIKIRLIMAQENEIIRYNNYIDEQEKIEEILENYKEEFEYDENAKIDRCIFCNKLRVYPYNFIQNNNATECMRNYNINNETTKMLCCINCFLEVEENNIKDTIYCDICKAPFIVLKNDWRNWDDSKTYNYYITNHNKSSKHKKMALLYL
jgi:hypothetical protein